MAVPRRRQLSTRPGGRTQVAQVVTAGAVLGVLLFATGLIERLPNAALAAIVVVIGVKLIDVWTLRQIFRLQKDAFVGAVATMLVVVVVGVEQGILLGVGVSILAHVRRQYHPKDVVLITSAELGKAQPAEPGTETEPASLSTVLERGSFSQTPTISRPASCGWRRAPHTRSSGSCSTW